MGEMGDRLKAAREAAGYRSARAAATRKGWTVSTYSAHENGQNDFGREDAISYARAFKTSPGHLYFGDPAPHIPARANTDLTKLKRPFPGALPQISGRHDFEFTDEWWQIPPSILQDLAGADAAHTVGFALHGDSMEPTISRTDIVFIDTSRQTIEPDGIWAVDYGYGRTLRRILIPRGNNKSRIVLRSDNKAYPDLSVATEDVAVHGRCVGRFSVF